MAAIPPFLISPANGNNLIGPNIFKCCECEIAKNTCEDLEVHIKTEHLNWLPFICPMCNIRFPSDLLIREHMITFHEGANRYIYNDNLGALNKLIDMKNKAIFNASIQLAEQFWRTMSNSLACIERGDQITINEEEKSNKNGNRSEEGATEIDEGGECQQSINVETDAQLNAIFGQRNIKKEFDDLSAMNDGAPSPNANELADDNSHLDALQNVAAMFSTSGASNRQSQMLGNGRRNSSGLFNQQKRILRNRPASMTTKKRNIGKSRRCHKEI